MLVLRLSQKESKITTSGQSDIVLDQMIINPHRLGHRFPILFGVKDTTPRVRVAPRLPPYPGCIGDGLEDAIVAFLSVSATASLKESRFPVVYCDISFSCQNRYSVCSLLLEKKRIRNLLEPG